MPFFGMSFLMSSGLFHAGLSRFLYCRWGRPSQGALMGGNGLSLFIFV